MKQAVGAHLQSPWGRIARGMQPPRKKKGARKRAPIIILLATTLRGPISGTAILTNKNEAPHIEPIPSIKAQSIKDI